MDAGNRYADPRLLELDPRPVPPARPLGEARKALARATPVFLGVADDSLERPWDWVGEGEGDVRTGFYVALQRLEQARGGATAPAGRPVAPAWPGLAAATEARWDMQGLLAPLTDAVLDMDPGGGEWTVRQTLAHALAGQRSYAWAMAWWISAEATTQLRRVPEAWANRLPSDEEDGSGSLQEIRRRLDALLDLGAEIWRSATQEDLATRSRWMGFPVTIGFRLGRWAAHLEEHTIQVEKTLVMLDHRPREVDRMVRLLYRAFGRLEAAAWALPSAALEEAGIAAAIVDAAAEVERIAGEMG